MKYSSYYMINCVKNKQPVDYAFINWINQIENYIVKNYGLKLLDLPDEAYMENYENGYSPQDMIALMQNEFSYKYYIES